MLFVVPSQHQSTANPFFQHPNKVLIVKKAVSSTPEEGETKDEKSSNETKKDEVGTVNVATKSPPVKANKDESDVKSLSGNRPTPKPSNQASLTTTGSVFMERAPVHHTETSQSAKIALDVSGFAAEDLQVQIEDYVVTVNGMRQNKLGDTYVIRRNFRLDRRAVDEDAIRANLSDGILEILVPKKAASGPRVIPISTEVDHGEGQDNKHGSKTVVEADSEEGSASESDGEHVNEGWEGVVKAE